MSQKNRTFWEQYQKQYKGADHYGYHWGGQQIIDEVSTLCKKHIQDKTVLEIGSGGGKWTKALFDMGAKSVDACDVHQTAINATKEHEPRANVFLIDGKGIKTESLYNVVFSYDVFLHLPPSLVMRYILDASRISQKMIFQLPDLDTKIGANLFRYYAERDVFEDPYTKGYMNFYAYEMVKSMAKIAGGNMTDLGVIGERDRLYLIDFK
jgi:trans-aconitate methyltransferase